MHKVNDLKNKRNMIKVSQMLVVNELEVSIVLLFLFILSHSLQNTQPTYHKHGSLNQDIFQRKEKMPSFHTIPWNGGDLQSHLLECYALLGQDLALC